MSWYLQYQLQQEAARRKQEQERQQQAEQQRQQEAQRQAQQQAQKQPTASPIPHDPSSPVIQDRNGSIWVRSDYEVKSVTTTHNPETPLIKQVTSYKIEQKPQEPTFYDKAINAPDYVRINFYPAKLVAQATRDPTMQNVVIPATNIGLTVGMAILAPEILPITTPAILAAGAVNVGVSQGLNYALTRQVDLSPKTLSMDFLLGGTFATTGTAALSGVGKIAPTVVKSVAGRAIVNAGVGGGAGYVLSGGDPAAAASGALTGAIFSAGTELVYNPTKAAIKVRTGLVKERLIGGEPTIGKAGTEVPTFISQQPIEALGNRRIRVIADVTENPINPAKGVNLRGMVNEYVGQTIPTAHATLNAENFNLKAGGETILKGFPQEATGYRKAEQLTHFYSAPGSEKYVNIYGGYAGISDAEESAFKLVIGGRASVLVTVNTPISERFTPLRGESEAAYLSRTSRLAGETGIAQETMLGKSTERQFVTTAQYERFGEQLQGSKFVSEGKIGTYQIKQLPSGRMGKIPLVRDMASTYTDLTIYKGRYEAAELTTIEPIKQTSTQKVLDLSAYNYESPVKASTPRAVLSMGSFGVISEGVYSSQIVQSLYQESIGQSTISQQSNARRQNSTSSTSQRSQSTNILPLSPSQQSIASDPLGLVSDISIPSRRTQSPSTSRGTSSIASILSIASGPSDYYSPSNVPASIRDVPIYDIPSMPSYPDFPDYPSPPSIPDYPTPPPPDYPNPLPSKPPAFLLLPTDKHNRLKTRTKGQRKDEKKGKLLRRYPVMQPKDVLKEFF